MKIFRRVAAIVFALCMVLTMGTWAAEVSVNENVDWGFETGSDNNHSGWNASYDKNNVLMGRPYINRAYNEDDANVHSGARSLRLFNDGNDAAVTAASVYAAAPRLAVFGTDTSIVVPANTRVLLEGFVKVASLGEGAYVNVTWYYGRIGNNKSQVAKIETANNTWQKFSHTPAWWAPANYANCFLMLELVGTGTVYFDDIFCGLTDNVCPNGDFEVGATSAAPTGWTFTRVSTSINPSWGTDAMVEQTSDGDRYLHLKNTTTQSPTKNHYMFTAINEVKGAQYVCTTRYKTTREGANPAIMFGTVKVNGWYDNMTYFTWEKLSEDADGWGTWRGTCVIPESDLDLSFFIADPGLWGSESYYDDVTLAIDSTPVLTEDAGTLNAVSHVVALKDRPSSLFIGVYEKKENNTLTLVGISPLSPQTVSAGQTAKLENTASVPSDGKTYCAKAFLWDDLSGLHAQTPYVGFGE